MIPCVGDKRRKKAGQGMYQGGEETEMEMEMEMETYADG